MVMKSAEDRPRCDAAYVLDGAMDRKPDGGSRFSPADIGALGDPCHR
jgi:hypothetical protein